MFRYLIFNGLKFQRDFICLGFPPHDITIMWFWLVVVREKSTHGGRGGGGVVRYFSQFRRVGNN